jgi:tRNA G18 (ribose-2'-O)-methylase SpoU
LTLSLQKSSFQISSISSTSVIHSNGRSERKRDRASAVSNKNKSSLSDLPWENFDFSHSPKCDRLFDKTGSVSGNPKSDDTFCHDSDLQTLHQREETADIALKTELQRKHNLWKHLDPQLIEQATNVILPFVQDERKERIRSVIKNRTRQTRFLFENPANPSNVWACLRTLDSFGIQYVDVVIQSGKYKGKAALSQKRGMRVAMGSAKWLTLKNHLNIESAMKLIKNEGYRIYCADVNPKSKDIRHIDWDESGKPICIVMGNEESGISQLVKEWTDESFYIPMAGFAESFNLSVATAITCAHLSACSDGNGNGPLRPGDLPEQEYKTLLFQGYLNGLNHKTARALLRKEGLVFPPELNLS